MPAEVTVIRSRATDHAAFKLAEALSHGGHRVELLVWDRRGDFLEPSDTPYTMSRFRMSAPYDRPSALLFLPLWWIYELAHLLRRAPDVYHACDLDTLWPAVLAKIIGRRKMCYTIFDFYANNLADGRCAILRRFLRRVVASVELLGLRFADAVFIADESRRAEIKAAKAKLVVTVFNTPPDCRNAPVSVQTAAQNRLSVAYVGSLVRHRRGLEHMVEAVEDVEGVYLLLAGTGRDEGFFRRVAETSDAVEFRGWIPSYEEVLSLECASDVLFRFSNPSIPKTRFESPNKLFEAMMCGKPILVSGDSAMAGIVTEDGCGLVVPYGDINAIRQALVLLRDDHELRRKLGENGRLAYEKKYSWSEMEQRLTSTYRLILGG